MGRRAGRGRADRGRPAGPATIAAYRNVVRVLRETLDPAPRSAYEVTADHAARFGRLYLAGTYKRGKASDAKAYTRSASSLATYLRTLAALWGHLLDLSLVAENPWKAVRKPQVEKKRKPVPAEADIDGFFGWVRRRYPSWERLHALLALKAVSGCRTLDLCQLRSDQLRDGRMVWEPGQTKNKEGRAVLLQDDLYQTLRRLAGPVHLWEGFVDDLRRFRPSTNRPVTAFKPATVRWVVNNIFREFAEAHPDRPRLSPHALRRRAVTLTAMATQSVDAAAGAIGIDAQTARSYYLDAQRAFDADEVFRRAAAVLRPKDSKGD